MEGKIETLKRCHSNTKTMENVQKSLQVIRYPSFNYNNVIIIFIIATCLK